MPWIEQQLIADGVSADGRIVVARAILDIITSSQILTMAVNAGGTGYVDDETFDLVGGTAVSVNGASIIARGRVVAQAAGVVTAVEIVSSGAYSALPGTTGAATTNSSGVGTGLTLDLTTQTARYTQDRSTFTNFTTDFEWIATSVKASNAPTIGIASALSGSIDSMRLLTASGFDNGETFLTQPGAPPSNLFYVNVPNQAPQLFMSVTERRVNILVSDGTFKQAGQMGLFIPRTNVDTNYPFPGICWGQTTSPQVFNTSFSTTNRSLLNPVDPGDVQTQYQYRDNVSPSWFSISQDNNLGTQIPRSVMWPAQGDGARYSFNSAPIPTGSTAQAAEMSPFTATAGKGGGSLSENEWFANDASSLGPQGPANLGDNNQLHFTAEAHIIANQPNNVQVVGIIDGFENIHGRGLNAFDEIETEPGRRYLVYNDTNTTSLFRWVAMEKV